MDKTQLMEMANEYQMMNGEEETGEEMANLPN